MIIGHSFVSRLQKCSFLEDHEAISRRLAEFMKVSNFIPHIHALGISGANVSNTYLNKFRNEVIAVNPSFVIIQLGSNDLANGTPPLSVASTLVDFAKDLLASGIKMIVICSVLPRSTYRNPASLDHKLLLDINIFNRVLYHFCYVEASILFYKHKGFHERSPAFFTRDGVHPSVSQGSPYWRSLRRAFFKVVEGFNRHSSLPGEKSSLIVSTCASTYV